jgi:hypothetical protein
MIRPRFLTAEDRAALVDLAQAGLVEHRVARRANALVLLDDGVPPLGYRASSRPRACGLSGQTERV